MLQCYTAAIEMQPGLIIVSNRLPVSVKKVDGVLDFFPSTGGLATGLASYAEDKRNKWIGWPGIPSDDLAERERQQIADELKKHNCYPVFLTKKQIDEYYNGYSNSVIWPLFHGNPIGEAAADDTTKLWKTYQRVNQAFADVVLALSQRGSNIWVHDYHLMTLPAMLRLERPDDKIGFFLHIPFPDSKTFRSIPEAEPLLAGLLGADLIGTQTESSVNNLLDCVQVLDVGLTAHHKVILADRVVRVTSFPISIDYAKYAKARKSRAVTREYAKLRLQYAGLKVILTVDRLDPSKGLVQRARAYQTLLRENPKLRGKVVMIMLVVPSRTDIAEYKHLQEDLEQVIHETNEEFGVMPWTPIEYLFTSLPFEQVTALYRRADVAFIAPLRDGMNLVAKEYLASKPGKSGVLVLSRTAGAAEELKEAVMVDALRPATLVKGLSKALSMPPRELKRRADKMQQQLSTATVQVWAGNFMHTLKQPLARRTRSLSPSFQREMQEAYAKAKNRLLLIDYDGVLVRFHRKPENALPPPEVLKIVRKLSSVSGNTVVIISGRSQADLEKWLGKLPLALIAEHGAFMRTAGSPEWQEANSRCDKDWQAKLSPIMEKYAARTEGAFVEQKHTSLVWHYRQARTYAAQKNLVILKRVLAPLAKKLNLQIHQGHMILEIKPDSINKGTAATELLTTLRPDFTLIIGDDYTDEDMFRTAPSTAYTVKVGPGTTAASYRIKNVAAVLSLLEQLGKQ